VKAEHSWAAEVNGQTVALLTLSRLEWHLSTGFIDDVAVDQAFRGHGGGSALLETLKAYAREHGFRGVFWEAQTDNKEAIDFALRHGFVFAGFNDRWYRNDDLVLQGTPEFLGIAVFLYWAAQTSQRAIAEMPTP